MLTKASAGRLLRFVLSGGVSFVAYYAAYVGFTEAGVPYLLSSVIGFFAYWISNFFLNRYWTYRSSGNVAREAAMHFLMHLGNQVVNMFGLYLLIEVAHIQYIWAQGILTLCFGVVVLLLSDRIFKS